MQGSSKYINKLALLTRRPRFTRRRDCEGWSIQFAAQWPETRLRVEVYTFGKSTAFRTSTECRNA